jgi:hypothetical protein
MNFDAITSDAALGIGESVVRHWPVIASALTVCGALWVYWKRENLSVVRNFWVTLEEEGGKIRFRLYSEQDAYLWNLFPSDPIMRWHLKKVARSTRPLSEQHPSIDYIPWMEPVPRLVALLRSHVSATPLQWYAHVCRVAGTIERPCSVLFAEQYPVGADMCWRNVLIHPATLRSLAAWHGKSLKTIKSQVEADSTNHYDLLVRLAEIASIVLEREKPDTIAIERINMSTIRVPGSESARFSTNRAAA